MTKIEETMGKWLSLRPAYRGGTYRKLRRLLLAGESRRYPTAIDTMLQDKEFKRTGARRQGSCNFAAHPRSGKKTRKAPGTQSPSPEASAISADP